MTEEPDGRRRRTERSKTAIAKALMEALRETGQPPTAEDIAVRAKVSRRSVFRLFEQMDDLYAEVIELIQAEVRARLDGPGLPGLPLPERITGFIGRLTALYEDVTPMRRHAERLRGKYPIIDARLLQDNKDLARYIEVLFGKNVKAKHRAELTSIVSALELALSWQAWDTLRTTQGLSAGKAREVIRRIVSALI
jgi:AcrR family transcriptional regulator